jgi:ABC-2 type transport system ATP-binding protein
MPEQAAIEVRDLVHGYGRGLVHDHLSFTVHEGSILGLLGKNGVGKTTLIRILMGFLAPNAGSCRVLGEASHTLSAEARRRIGLVFEGHLAYDFMTIEETERFFRGWYPRWKRDVFHDLIGRLGLALDHRIRHMAEGQRSQVVLAVVTAQDPDLSILDDYAMGLDAGHRRLFLHSLGHDARAGGKTVRVTSLADFMATFTKFELPAEAAPAVRPAPEAPLPDIEREPDGTVTIHAFVPYPAVAARLRAPDEPRGRVRRLYLKCRTPYSIERSDCRRERAQQARGGAPLETGARGSPAARRRARRAPDTTPCRGPGPRRRPRPARRRRRSTGRPLPATGSARG